MKESVHKKDVFVSFRKYLPEKESQNEYAIFFVISNDYSFATANMIMGLYRHSPALMRNTDIIVYHNGISEKNKKLLKDLHNDMLFMQMGFPKSWSKLLEYPRTCKWGEFVVAKLFGFFLIHQYKKVLLLDVDMLVTQDISPLFEIDTEMAWRPVLIWNAAKLFQPYLKNKEDLISGANAGLILYTDKLKKYNISIDEIAKTIDVVSEFLLLDSYCGGTEECILSWLVYDKGIKLTELDIYEYNTIVPYIAPQTRLVHFMDYRSVPTKPWKSLASYLYFTDWSDNYLRWINMGGDGPINFSKDDYYRLFAFEESGNILKKNREIEKYKQELDKLKKSFSWKITKPLRLIAKVFRTLTKKVRSCFKN